MLWNPGFSCGLGLDSSRFAESLGVGALGAKLLNCFPSPVAACSFEYCDVLQQTSTSENIEHAISETPL